jgi:diacylglycerol kinase family enzyme
VAAVAAVHGIPFVCVPAGTRNHFALDVGVDRHDLTGVLDAFTGGVERRIDAAEVNGRMFLNNVSLGIYGDAVRSPAYRDAKVRTLLETAAEVMGPSMGELALDLADDLGREHRHPAIVLVSNNPYALDRPLARGTRSALDSGQLGIVVLDAPATARAFRAGPGARRGWRSMPRPRSTPGLTARRWTWIRRCGSPAARPRCGSGSPRATRAPRHQRVSTPQAAPRAGISSLPDGPRCYAGIKASSLEMTAPARAARGHRPR